MNGTDGRRGDVLVIEERVLSPVDDIKEAQVIGRERERRWSGIGWARARRESGKGRELVVVTEVNWEDDGHVIERA